MLTCSMLKHIIFSLKHGHIHEKRIHFYRRQTRLFSGWRRVAGTRHNRVWKELRDSWPTNGSSNTLQFHPGKAEDWSEGLRVCLLKSSRLHPRETTDKDIKRVCEPRWTDHAERSTGLTEAHTRMKKIRETPKAQKGNSREGKGPFYNVAC